MMNPPKPDWPLPGWRPVQPFPFAEARRAFTGPASAQAPVRIAYYQRPDRSLAAVARFQPVCEGAPGHAHGGAVLTVLAVSLPKNSCHTSSRSLRRPWASDNRTQRSSSKP